jgi:hypothetical protein
MTGKKLEPPLYIAMNTDEALTRFVHTDPREVERPKARPKKRPRLKSQSFEKVTQDHQDPTD